MLEGLVNEEVDHFMEERPTIVLLFQIDVVRAVSPYVSKPTNEERDIKQETTPTSVEELRYTRKALERELAISQCVKASTLDEINLGTIKNRRTLKVENELAPNECSALVGSFMEYLDVFTWSYNDMNELDPQYYQH